MSNYNFSEAHKINCGCGGDIYAIDRGSYYEYPCQLCGHVYTEIDITNVVGSYSTIIFKD